MIKVTRTCNKCGTTAEDIDYVQANNIHTFSTSGSYGSEFPGDMESCRFDLCSACLKAFTDTFQFKIAFHYPSMLKEI